MSEQQHSEVSRLINLVCAYCGYGYVALVFAGWWFVARYYPLHAPTDSAQDIQSFYQSNPTLIRLGLVIVMWGAALFIGFTAALTECFSRIEGRRGALSTIAALTGFSIAMLTFYPPLWWLVAAFRPESQSLDILYMLNDAGWLQFIGGIALLMPVYPAMVAAVFIDKNDKPIFPRWIAYYCIWTFTMSLPDQLLFFFKDGPFAWDGLFGFWIPVTVFAMWILVISTYMIKAFGKSGAAANYATPS